MHHSIVFLGRDVSRTLLLLGITSESWQVLLVVLEIQNELHLLGEKL